MRTRTPISVILEETMSNITDKSEGSQKLDLDNDESEKSIEL